MGYGGTGYATVDVDIVQTDVDAIVDGLAGGSGTTLSDFETYLMAFDGYLYDGMDGVVDWLSYIENHESLILDCLFDVSSGSSAAELLADIYFILSDVWDQMTGAIRTVVE